MSFDPKSFNVTPGSKLLHRFRTKILSMTAWKNGLIVLTERGPYWFPTPESKPRKIKP